MGKSLRSKRKQDNKTIKRQTVFGEAAAAREKRIAERLHHAAIDQILASQGKSAVSSEPAAQEDAMEIETPKADEQTASTSSTKKSTGGWSKKRKQRGKKSRKSRK